MERTAKNEEEKRSCRWRPFVYESTRRLRFVLDVYCPGAAKKKWAGFEAHRLEDVVGEIV